MTAAATPLLTGSRSAIKPLSFSRVLAYEFRKSVSTRASRWTLAAAIAGTIATAAILYLSLLLTDFDTTQHFTWIQLANSTTDSFMGIAQISMILFSLFLILMVTTDWTNRSIMTTYTLTPRRGWVLSAQLIVALTYALALWVLCLGLGTLVAGLLSPLENVNISWSVTAWDVFGPLLSNLGLAISAFLLGIAVMNGSAAIIMWMMVPAFLNTLLNFNGVISDIAQWLNLKVALNAAVADPGAAVSWGRTATSVVLWLGVPAVIGTWRTLHRDAG